MLSSYNEAKRKIKPNTEDTVINIQHGDIELREDFIFENRPFILDCVTNYKKDNRIENLEVMTRQKHSALHSTKNLTCGLGDCDKKHHCRGYCDKHRKIYKTGKNKR